MWERDAGYAHGSMPVFSHDKDDIQAFRMITSQFYVNGNATQSQIARAFGVTLVSVKRAVKTGSWRLRVELYNITP